MGSGMKDQEGEATLVVLGVMEEGTSVARATLGAEAVVGGDQVTEMVVGIRE